jgi:hypothetical protein
VSAAVLKNRARIAAKNLFAIEPQLKISDPSRSMI